MLRIQHLRNRLLLALALVIIPTTLSAFVWKCSPISISLKGLGIEYSFVKGAECHSLGTPDIGRAR
jgi:hypothetical protein